MLSCIERKRVARFGLGYMPPCLRPLTDPCARYICIRRAVSHALVSVVGSQCWSTEKDDSQSFGRCRAIRNSSWSIQRSDEPYCRPWASYEAARTSSRKRSRARISDRKWEQQRLEEWWFAVLTGFETLVLFYVRVCLFLRETFLSGVVSSV